VKNRSDGRREHTIWNDIKLSATTLLQFVFTYPLIGSGTGGFGFTEISVHPSKLTRTTSLDSIKQLNTGNIRQDSSAIRLRHVIDSAILYTLAG
jgi:hypothetical protein